VDGDRWQRIMMLAATAALMACLAWMECPPWQRELIKRTIRMRAYRLLHRLARASGRRAMGDELAGRTHEAEAGYSFTERVSRARDRL